MFGFKCASDIYGHQIRGKAKLTSARMLCEKVISVFFFLLKLTQPEKLLKISLSHFCVTGAAASAASHNK